MSVPLAATISAISATAALGYSAYSGERSAKAQSRGRKDQKAAQNEATAAAVAQQRANEQAAKKANQQQPDIMAILARAQGQKGQSTQLTGPLGLFTNPLGG